MRKQSGKRKDAHTKELLSHILGDLTDFFMSLPNIKRITKSDLQYQRYIRATDWRKMIEDQKKKRVLRDLRRKKYLIAKQQGEQFLITISTNAVIDAIKTQIKTSQALLPTSKLCIVVFDFPNGATAARNHWRRLLLSCGFKKIQLSVYSLDKNVLMELLTLVDLLGAKKWIRIFYATPMNKRRTSSIWTKFVVAEYALIFTPFLSQKKIISMQIVFPGYPKIQAGISERTNGSMTWWNRVPVDPNTQIRRDQFFTKQGINPNRVVAGGLQHGTHVALVKEQCAGAYLLNTDALITQTPNLVLTITAADCLPIFFLDPVTQSIGIAHAGWRGLIAGIVEETVHQFQVAYATQPTNLIVIIGPHIKSCHYEVKKEVADQFHQSSVNKRDEKFFVDLSLEAQIRLQQHGVTQFSVDPHCTFCHAERFFSARHDNRYPVQGMAAYIGLKPSPELSSK